MMSSTRSRKYLEEMKLYFASQIQQRLLVKCALQHFTLLNEMRKESSQTLVQKKELFHNVKINIIPALLL